jgi:RNA ligase (TIGR02306 family)
MKLATLERIHSITIHPNADNLLCAKIKEWPVVIKKNEFNEGDLVVFISIDSIVPSTNPYFKFMEKMKYRVWSARFRKMPSQGLVCPLTAFPQLSDLIEGLDVTEVLGITKYERPIDISVGGDAKNGFPSGLIRISDEDNLLGYAEALKELVDKKFYVSLKYDGSSTTFIFNNNEFKACSRRFEMKENSGFTWQAVNRYDIKNKLIKLNRNIAIQAESIGPKLNGNSLELSNIEIRVFRAKNLETHQIFNLDELYALCMELDLPMVDIIETDSFDVNKHTISYFQNIANSVSWPTNHKPGEGIVIAPVVPFYSSVLGKEWSAKLINIDYK